MLGVRLVLIALVLLGGCDEADDSSLTALKPGRLRLDRETVAFFPTPQLFTQTFDLQLYNSGQTELNFESIEFQPQLNAFVVNNPPVKLAPKEGVLMSITFAPGDAVVHESDLQFRFDGDNSPLSIPVTGTGQANPACAPCDAPPASFCMSDEVLALYERADGACEEGMCAYEVQDVRCTVGCDVDQGTCLDLDAGPSGGTPNPNPNPISENDSGPETPGGEGGTGTPGGDVDAGNLADPEDAGPEPVFRIAHSNPEQCYTCTDWGNPTTCSIAMTNCPLPGSDGYGQEIHYPQAGPVELLPSSDVLLQDPKTGLSWWRCANGGANTPCDADQDRVTFAGAQQRCAQLTAEDGTALRVPTLGELLTIVNYESQTGLMDLPNLDLPTGTFWTQTANEPGNPLTGYWAINTTTEALALQTVQDQAHILCTGGDPWGANGFTETADSILDARTGLEWKKCAYGQNTNTTGSCTGTPVQLPLQDAMAHCSGLSGGLAAPWRLPAIREITSLALWANEDLELAFGPGLEGQLGRWLSGTPVRDLLGMWVFSPQGSEWQKGGTTHTFRCVRAP